MGFQFLFINIYSPNNGAKSVEKLMRAYSPLKEHADFLGL